ncbi:MAG TPA: Ger(x)C family spore germination protein [Bacillota bacterium]|nr:Ger(x)C family spore germination protein [Bacillota bacterium]
MTADNMDYVDVSSDHGSHPLGRRLTVAACVLCVVILVFALGGCWDARDIDHIGFIMGMGVDESDDGKIVVWVQMALPSSGPEGAANTPAWLGSAAGNTMMDAMSALRMKSAKTLFRGHVKVLVIGEKIARKGLTPILDYLARDSQFRYNSWVLVTSDPVGKIFEVEADQENMASSYINLMMRHATLSSVAPQSRFRDLLSTAAEPGDQPVLARVSLVKSEPEEEEGEQDEAQQGVWGQRTGNEGGKGKKGDVETKSDIEISGSAALHGDLVVGWLDPVQTAMVLMARNRLKEYSFLHMVPGTEGDTVGVKVLHSRATIELPPRHKMTRTGLRGAEVRIRVTGCVYIEEVMSEEQFVSIEADRNLSRGVSDQIEAEMESLIEIAQNRLGTDIFGIGEAVRRRISSDVWEEEIAPIWRDIFKEIKIIPEVSLKVERQGTTMTSPRPQA